MKAHKLMFNGTWHQAHKREVTNIDGHQIVSICNSAREGIRHPMLTYHSSYTG